MRIASIICSVARPETKGRFRPTPSLFLNSRAGPDEVDGTIDVSWEYTCLPIVSE